MKKHLINLFLIVAIPLSTAPSLAPGYDGLITDLLSAVTDREDHNDWTLAADDVVATVYNATASQCNGNPLVTASRFRIDPDNIPSQRVIAMERTMMSRCGIRYGDVVRVSGTGTYDGLWRVEDTMNKRFAGQNRIDFLVPPEIRTGKWKGISVYTAANDRTMARAKERLQQGKFI